MARPAVLSIFGIKPFRIGSNESFARELSRQLASHGWASIQCFQESPPEPVRQFLALPNVTLDVFARVFQPGVPAAGELAGLIRRHAPSIIHLHYTGFLTAAPWIARACGVKRIFITDHTSRPEGHQSRRAPGWKRALTRLINKPVTNVIAVSEYGRRCMTALDVLPADRFKLIYNSVELSRVRHEDGLGRRFKAEHGIPPERPLVVQVSWIIPEKGIVDLLKAFQLLVAGGKDVHLALVGEGAYRAEYTRLADELGLSGRVTWTGIIEDPFAAGVYAAADIVCQVSRWEEVFGWTIAEAMAHRRPLLATRVGGIPELVTDGVSGFLVDRGDTAAMAQRLSTLLESDDLRAKMGTAGRTHVEEQFELTRNVGRLLDVYGVGQVRRKPA